MGAFQGINWLIVAPFILLVVVPGFLPLIIKRPEGPNRFGIPYEPKDAIDGIRNCIDKYATFNGRATRLEFWSFFLAAALVHLVALSTSYVAGFPYELISATVLALPTVAVGVRRLHDVNRSGWWILIGLFVPSLVALIVLWLMPSQRGAAKLVQRSRIVI
jgi:uncharacterized membrane protein YhaH (DUF805 family)